MKSLVQSAIQRRGDWLATIETDSYRLFHGAAEGIPGVTIDRYGSEILVQVFRETMQHDWQQLAAWLQESQEDVSAVSVVRRHRGKETLATVGDLADRIRCREAGRLYWNSLVQAGNDPWFYLDFRAARRFIASVSRGARVANFFSYTGTAGIAAATAGAADVSNIDFGRWCLEVARDNDVLNGVESRILRDDFFSVARQWAGGGAKNRRRARRGPAYKAETFDVVILDPPTESKGPNGAVDIVRDYPSLAKPCIQMLAPGGWLVCSHHHTSSSFDAWQAIVRRTAAKIGRSIARERRILPDRDFPMVGDEPLLKVLAVQVS